MKRLIFVGATALFFFTAASATWYRSKLHRSGKAGSHPAAAVKVNINIALKEKLNDIAAMARQYTAANRFNATFCFFIDMGMPSGRPRIFVYDLRKNAVIMEGLVAHGRCNQNWLAGRKYGNTVGCGCTSLGRYKIGKPYQGKFGLAYKLTGLDATNSNAYARFIVLHSMQCVPETPVDPYPICQSDGCPTVSPGFLQQLAVRIDGSQQPVLLWIFE